MLKYEVLSKSVQWEPSYSTRSDGRIDRQTDRQTDRHDEANTRNTISLNPQSHPQFELLHFFDLSSKPPNSSAISLTQFLLVLQCLYIQQPHHLFLQLVTSVFSNYFCLRPSAPIVAHD